MENPTNDTVIYSLNVEDVQNVAIEEIGRELSQIEIERIVDAIASNINWYDAIASAILTGVKTENFC